MTSLVVFGGTGFFAKSLYAALKYGSGHSQIISISRSENCSLPSFVVELLGDVTSFESLTTLPGRFEGARCIYLADPSSHNIPSEEQRFREMLLSVNNVIKFCKHRGIRDFTYASSGAVYDYSNELKHENSHLKDIREQNYSSAKIMSERFIEDCGKAYNINCKIARCFSFVGSYLPNTHFAIMNFINNAILGRDIIINGSGLEIRSYLHQLELGKSLSKLIWYNKPITVNIGSSTPISILELANKIGRMYSVNVVGPLNASMPNQNVYVPATHNYSSLFGPIETFSLTERIDLTYNALKKNYAK